MFGDIVIGRQSRRLSMIGRGSKLGVPHFEISRRGKNNYINFFFQF